MVTEWESYNITSCIQLDLSNTHCLGSRKGNASNTYLDREGTFATAAFASKEPVTRRPRSSDRQWNQNVLS